MENQAAPAKGGRGRALGARGGYRTGGCTTDEPPPPTPEKGLTLGFVLRAGRASRPGLRTGGAAGAHRAPKARAAGAAASGPRPNTWRPPGSTPPRGLAGYTAHTRDPQRPVQAARRTAASGPCTAQGTSSPVRELSLPSEFTVSVGRSLHHHWNTVFLYTHGGLQVHGPGTL